MNYYNGDFEDLKLIKIYLLCFEIIMFFKEMYDTFDKFKIRWYIFKI